jgi:hypothetical protein
MHTAQGEGDFKAQLIEQGINTVVRRNTEGRIYGITFIDHASRSVWNGSQLGKNLSANVFNQWWNDGIKPKSMDFGHDQIIKNSSSQETAMEGPFSFLDKTNSDSHNAGNVLAEVMGGLLPTDQGEDYEELAFENQMKRKRKHRRG